MKDFIKSIRLTLVFFAFFAVCYVLVLWIFAKVAGPNHGNIEVAMNKGKVTGAANVGQRFISDMYFWGRPSYAGGNGYDASSSCGSNKGPNNEEYLTGVASRTKVFMMHHPYLKHANVPAEMVTASGSGLDPDITPQCAYVQAKRVAETRGLSEQSVKELVKKHVDGPLFGLFGPMKVNVLKLNIALDNMSNGTKR